MIELPKMPEPALRLSEVSESGHWRYFTADQLRAYGAAWYAAGMEAAAVKCVDLEVRQGTIGRQLAVRACAEAIRAAIPKTPKE